MMRFLQFFKSASLLLSAVSLILFNGISLKWPLIVSALVVHQPLCLTCCVWWCVFTNNSTSHLLMNSISPNSPVQMPSHCGETTSDDVYNHCEAQKRFVIGLWPLAVSLGLWPKYHTWDIKWKESTFVRMWTYSFDIQRLRTAFITNIRPHTEDIILRIRDVQCVYICVNVCKCKWKCEHV